MFLRGTLPRQSSRSRSGCFRIGTDITWYRPCRLSLSTCADRTDAGGRHRAFQADLGSVEGVRALHTDIMRELGPIDILFVNHGIIGHMLGRDGNIEDLDFSIFAHTWQNNTAPAFLVCLYQCHTIWRS